MRLKRTIYFIDRASALLTCAPRPLVLSLERILATTDESQRKTKVSGLHYHSHAPRVGAPRVGQLLVSAPGT